MKLIDKLQKDKFVDLWFYRNAFVIKSGMNDESPIDIGPDEDISKLKTTYLADSPASAVLYAIQADEQLMNDFLSTIGCDLPLHEAVSRVTGVRLFRISVSKKYFKEMNPKKEFRGIYTILPDSDIGEHVKLWDSDDLYTVIEYTMKRPKNRESVKLTLKLDRLVVEE